MYADNIIEVTMEGENRGNFVMVLRLVKGERLNQDIVPKLTVAPSSSVPSMLPLYAHYDE